MAKTDPVDLARKSFAANRQVAERNLKEMREYARNLLDFRHNRTDAGPVDMRRTRVTRSISPVSTSPV